METRIAKQCPYFQTRLEERESEGGALEVKYDNLAGPIMAIVISYLHFRERYSKDLEGDIPKFVIDPEHGHELLKATQFLRL